MLEQSSVYGCRVSYCFGTLGFLDGRLVSREDCGIERGENYQILSSCCELRYWDMARGEVKIHDFGKTAGDYSTLCALMCGICLILC